MRSAIPNKASSCRRKVRHATEQAAWHALRRTQKNTGELALTVYRCQHCGGWHVGRARRPVRRKLRATRLVSLIDKAMRRTGHIHERTQQ